MKKSFIIISLIILASFAISAYLYPQMPDRMISHWGINGEANGYMGKFWGLFLMPVISLAVFLLLILIPKLDPLKANVEKFKKQFNNFIVFIILFFFYIYLLTVFWNLGSRFDMNRAIAPAFGILFYYCGVLIESAKKNWFIGIRTPWTLSSEEVWDKTHKLGGKLFKITGAISFLGLFFPRLAFLFILVPVLFSTLYVIVYSYFEYKKVIK
ncbi:MAG: SdpI family protein [Candidatus Paceibacterota bacterium]